MWFHEDGSIHCDNLYDCQGKHCLHQKEISHAADCKNGINAPSKKVKS